MPDRTSDRPQTITRDEWVAKYARIVVSGITVSWPLQERYAIDAGLALLRVGSLWKEDVEQHVYSIEQAVLAMRERRSRGGEMVVVTPIFVFRRHGDGAVPVTDESVLKKASYSFTRLFGEQFRRMQRG